MTLQIQTEKSNNVLRITEMCKLLHVSSSYYELNRIKLQIVFGVEGLKKVQTDQDAITG